MPTLDITDDHRDRIETLREELAAAHAGEYASVDTADALHYLLDLAEAVDDPGREADPEVLDREAERDKETDSDASAARAFDREVARERLEARNRKHGDPDDESEMDLYGIAAAFDVAGRSEMPKAELIEGILEAAERLAADPFDRVDLDVVETGAEEDGADESEDGKADDESEDGEADDVSGDGDAEDVSGDGDADDGTGDAASAANATPSATSDEGSSQLNTMMSLLDTHDDKWHEADGDARYEVELPDGDVETARTKDDVRALLFKNY